MEPNGYGFEVKVSREKETLCVFLPYFFFAFLFSYPLRIRATPLQSIDTYNWTPVSRYRTDDKLLLIEINHTRI